MANPSSSDPSTPNIWPQHAHALAGLWSNTTYELYDPSTTPPTLYSSRSNPLGIVQLSPTAYLSAHLAHSSRLGPLPSGRKWQVAGDAEVAHVARGLSMYCGRVELYEDEEGLWWRTKVDVASDPERIGGWEVRRVRVIEWEDGGDGDGKGGERRAKVIELRPKQDLFADDGTLKRAVLQWVRLE